jgi:hypothetical protein
VLEEEGILSKKLGKAVKKTMGNGGKSPAMPEVGGILGKKLVKAIKDHRQWQPYSQRTVSQVLIYRARSNAALNWLEMIGGVIKTYGTGPNDPVPSERVGAWRMQRRSNIA